MKNPLQTISLVTFLGLLLAIVYNIGYFSKIDWALLSILSIEDHISSGIAFLPVTISILVISMCAGILHRKDSQNAGESSASEVKNSLINFLKDDALVFFIVFILYFLAMPYNEPFVIVVVIIAIFPFLFTGVIEKVLLSFSIDFRPQTARITFLLSVLFIMIFYLGGVKCMTDLKIRKEKFLHTITIEGSSQQAQILRYFQNGFLANNGDELIVIHHDRIIRIKNVYKNNVPSLSCLIGFICLQNENKPEKPVIGDPITNSPEKKEPAI